MYSKSYFSVLSVDPLLSTSNECFFLFLFDPLQNSSGATSYNYCIFPKANSIGNRSFRKNSGRNGMKRPQKASDLAERRHRHGSAFMQCAGYGYQGGERGEDKDTLEEKILNSHPVEYFSFLNFISVHIIVHRKEFYIFLNEKN